MLVILDRDGVINFDSENYIKSPDEWIPIPGSLDAIATLNQASHTVVIATNQSGIARGLYDETMLEKIHDKMKNELAKVGGHLDGIFYCPHHPDDDCNCRKPKPGLLLEIQQTFKVDFADSLMIGDTAKDIEAAITVGCDAVLVKTGKGAQNLDKIPNHISTYDDLAGAILHLV